MTTLNEMDYIVRNELCRLANITSAGTIPPAIIHALSLVDAAIKAHKTELVNSYLHCTIALVSGWNSTRRVKFLVTIIGFVAKYSSIASQVINDLDKEEWEIIHRLISEKVEVNVKTMNGLPDVSITLVMICATHFTIRDWAYKSYFGKLLDEDTSIEDIDTSRQVALALATEVKDVKMVAVLNKEPNLSSNK